MAALANDDARTAYTQIVLGARLPEMITGLGEGRRERAIDVLLQAGLVEPLRGNELEAGGTLFRNLLAQQPKRQALTGVARFMRLGRIVSYPASRTERRELLGWIAGEAIKPGEDLTERQVNERLVGFTDNVALLRRYLVDFGLLKRTPSGSSYFRPEEG